MDLINDIKAEANNLGFSLAGITSPRTPDHFTVFESWLAGGRHGSMAYLSRADTLAKRVNPRLLMPGAISILCLAYPYPNAARQRETSVIKLRGSVASYARLKDYHQWLPKLIDELIHRLEARLGHSIVYSAFTDSAPILERDLAWRAGLGWIGKNGCLIHPDAGSCFFLAEVLLDLDLPQDTPFPVDRCGSCTRCLDACPTQCILPDRTIDAKRCISYLTIEHKGAIPTELRQSLGSCVFGCDVCQSVCPWNGRVLQPDYPEEAIEREALPAQPDLMTELKLSEVLFREKYEQYPVSRARREGYLRNVAIVLGNSRSPSAIAGLAESMTDDPSPVVRATCAWALGNIGSGKAGKALHSRLDFEGDETVREEIQLALSRC